MKEKQYGLFESKDQIKKEESAASRNARWEKYLDTLSNQSDRSTHLSILRSFVYMHFNVDRTFLKRPLLVLAGRTLEDLAQNDWKTATAYMREVKLNPNDKDFYMKEKT